MSRGLGKVQRGVLEVVAANPDGLAVDAIVGQLYGKKATAAQFESVRRAIRTLCDAGLVEVAARWERRPRRSLKRFVDLAPCDSRLCDSCARRKRRVRLADWHRKAMRANAKHDRAWLDDLALAEASGFVHETGSARLVDEKPAEIDMCDRRIQFVSPAK